MYEQTMEAIYISFLFFSQLSYNLSIILAFELALEALSLGLRPTKESVHNTEGEC